MEIDFLPRLRSNMFCPASDRRRAAHGDVHLM